MELCFNFSQIDVVLLHKPSGMPMKLGYTQIL